MTQREFFVAVANLQNIPQELVDYANAQAKKVADKNDSRNARARAKKADINAPLIAQIKRILEDGNVHPCSEIAASLGVNIPKVSALMKPFVDEGTIIKENVKNGKNKAVAYKNA